MIWREWIVPLLLWYYWYFLIRFFWRIIHIEWLWPSSFHANIVHFDEWCSNKRQCETQNQLFLPSSAREKRARTICDSKDPQYLDRRNKTGYIKSTHRILCWKCAVWMAFWWLYLICQFLSLSLSLSLICPSCFDSTLCTRCACYACFFIRSSLGNNIHQ